MLLDVAIGLILAMLMLPYTPWTSLPWFSLYTVAFALAPDLDVILSRLLNIPSTRHRELLHRPLLVIPGTFFLIAPFDLMLATTAVAALFLHFLHDSIGIGWGVQWLYPISRDSFSFLYHLPGGRKMRWHPIYRWKHGEIEHLAAQYGDPHWFRNIYLRCHPYAITEAAVFVFAAFLWVLAVRNG